ncbi:DUF1295 domain-containing protein [Erythrobacter sp. YT30]|uniref:DUF1295 domain-containing protein n=1 Tax=Erythrobacter sp. YT30 TaxID=1735012 RepID=UPI00076D5C87|nr:DUF1295 domain-containing protein [Erythrobacter sp. YT30]KWV93381.1 hypothetical protein AUC45_04560 [Erythrobacter sp. YT30]
MKSILVVIFVSLFSLAFAFYAGVHSVEIFGVNAFLICAVIALLVNWIAFVPSAIAQSDKYYDSFGAITYLSTTGFAVWAVLEARGEIDTRAIVLAAMVALWCIRLGTFLYIRIKAKGGTDSRFEKIKKKPTRFLAAWTLQALWVVLTASAALIAITTTDPKPIGVFFWIGLVIWVAGITIEAVADAQKSKFKSDPDNKGDFIDVGLWKWSRHPNYFGEITLWTGVLIIAIPVLQGLSWLAVISPLFVTLLLTKISGINLQEEQAQERWGDDPEYQKYRENTPVLVPMPPKS